MTTPAFTTASANELLLAFVSADELSTPNTTVTSVTGGGLTWVLVQRTNAQSGDSEIWRAFAPAVLKSVTVTASLSQAVVSSLTVASFSGVNTSGTNGSGSIGALGSGHAATGAPTASLVTTQANSLIIGVGNDFDSAIARTPLAGQAILHQSLSSTQDTYWVQDLTAETAAKGTKITLGDSAPTTDQYNLSICEVLAAPAVLTPQLTLSGSSLAFGSLVDGASATASLTVTSSGTGPVTVSSLSVTGTGFTLGAVTLPAVLNPGQTLAIPVTFAPLAAGAATGTLTIGSNSTTGATASVGLSGTGIAAVSTLGVSATSLPFGSVADGSTSSLSLTLTSTGNSSVTVNSATISGAGFSIPPGLVPKILAPGQTLAILVTFAPTTVASVTGTLTIGSNSSTGSSTTVTLTGTGTATSSTLAASVTSLAFGTIADGTTVTKSITLTSTGNSAVTVSGATISGAGFSLGSGLFPKVLSPGQTLVVPITFAPRVAGTVSGLVTFNSNSSAGPISVAISGFGEGQFAAITMSSTSLNFGSVADGSSTSQTLTIASTGTAPLKISSASLTGTGFSVAAGTFPVTLNPGAPLHLAINFAPTTTGAIPGTLTLSSNAETEPTSLISLAGTGTAAPSSTLSLSATSLAFGSVVDGSSKSLLLTLTSSGTAAVTVNSVAIAGTGFSTTSSGLPMTLSPGQSLTLSVTFAPTAAAADAGTLTIGSTSSTGATNSVALSGTGTAATNPILTVSSSTLSFGTVTDGTSATLTETLSSTGNAAVTVSSAAVTGTGFSLTGGTFPITLNPGTTATLTIQFAPTTAAAEAGTLVVSSNSTSGATTSVALSGTGEAPVSYSVELTWSAPSSSTDPVAGYHIYRAVSGSATFTLLNSSLETATSYLDSTVTAGTSYVYEVKSVDSSGTESTASNEFTATIP